MDAGTLESTPDTATQTENIGELAAALAAAQAEIINAVKTSFNPFYVSRYADLATVMDACRAPLSKHGLAVIQTTDGTDGAMITIITTLAHKSGQWIRGRLVMRAEKTDPQTIGKCITYARRYALSAIVGVAPEDDDGNSASGLGDAPPAAGARSSAKKPAGPGVNEMLRTGQAKLVPPVSAKPAAAPPAPPPSAKPAPLPAAQDKIPERLQELMGEAGVSIYGLRKYLEGKGWIRTNAGIETMKEEIYHQMIKPENWKTVVLRITEAQKSA